jgi:catechol 2,3-dioxygenase-like lactoylglutathione lyase family enzyme
MLTDAVPFGVLAAADLQRARAWYAEKLGLTPAMQLEGLDMFMIGGGQFVLYETPLAGTARSTAMGLTVRDLASEMAELRSRGVVFEDYDIENGPKTVDGVIADDSGGMAAWFTDCEGNIINLVQLPRDFPRP